MAKIYETKDKAQMLGFVRLISNATHTLKSTELHEASNSFRFFENIVARLNAVTDKELGTKEDFAVTVQRLPDIPNPVPPAQVDKVESPQSPVKKKV